MTSGSRAPTWKERENNKKRERRRRAIAAKIYHGLRMYGNYKLPKHCDNNEVLKSLCRESGWVVEEDGTTYRRGCKPPAAADGGGASSGLLEISPVSSSYASPASSSFPSPARSYPGENTAALILPWLKGVSGGGGGGSHNSGTTTPTTAGFPSLFSSSSRLSFLPPLNIPHRGSFSAPVTPPLSSPTHCPHPPTLAALAKNYPCGRAKTDWDAAPLCHSAAAAAPDCAATAFAKAWSSQTPSPLNAVSSKSSIETTPIPTPTHHGSNHGSNAASPTRAWMGNISSSNNSSSSSAIPPQPPPPLWAMASSSSSSSSLALDNNNNSGHVEGGFCSSAGIMWRPGFAYDEFVGQDASNKPLLPVSSVGRVRPWVGEVIHEEAPPADDDDLELTLGNPKLAGST